MTVAFLVAALLAQAQPTATPPQAIAAPAEADAQAGRMAAALDLTRLLFPLCRQTAQLDRVISTDMRAGLLKDKEIAELEAEMPGLVSAMLGAMRPVLLKSLERDLPAYQQAVAQIYARHMDEQEIRDAMQFFASPGGRKFIEQVNANMSFAPIVDSVVADPDAPIGGKDIANVKEDAARRAVDKLDADQTMALMTLAGHSWTKKLPAIRADMNDLDEKFTNKEDPESDKELEAVVTRVVERFLKQADRK